MSKNMTRRDLLNGMAFSLAGAAIGAKSSLADNISDFTQAQSIGDIKSAQQNLPDGYYPPLKIGIRGNHNGSFEVAHKLARQGNRPKHYEELEEEYDLIVVGGGISGLAAAYYYQKHAGGEQRILILDNHDDFGGHAKRNEFHSQGKMLLGFGGSQNLEFTDNYSTVASELLEELGIDLNKLEQATDPESPMVKMNQPMGLFIKTKNSAKTVIGRWLQAAHGSDDIKALIQQLDFSEDDKARLISFYIGERDCLEGLSIAEKIKYLQSTAYNDFLTKKVGLKNIGLSLFDQFIRANYSVGGDCVSVAEAFAMGAPGLNSVGWLGKFADTLTFDAEQPYDAKYFPDGNATIARLLVRKLIPNVAPPGKDMFDIATAEFDYQQLDQAGNFVKLRLNSTAVHVENLPHNKVVVSYVDKSGSEQGASKERNVKVKANRCILACYNGIIPHLCPEMPEQQKVNLQYGVKVPLVYVNVLLRDGGVINRAGAKMYSCPNSYYDTLVVAPLTTLGNYSNAVTDGDPVVLHMNMTPPPQRNPNNPQQTARDLYRLGRYRLYTTPFSEYESNIKDQLNSMFGQHGFDADHDIEAITVNRWSHGYAYDYMDLFDPKWPPGEAPHELGRKPFGNITIANTDSEAYAYVNGAIDAAWRAVKEQFLR